MSSTTSSPSGFLSSPRGQQRLLWVSGIVLVAGIATFLGVYLSRGTSQPLSTNVSTISSPPAKTNSSAPPRGQVKASPDALRTARTFLESAVVRKNLDASYGIVGPYLKGGLTRGQWRTGNIPVPFYPASNAKTTEFFINESHPKSLLIEMVLRARKGTHIGKGYQAYKLGMNLVGKKWLVTTFAPEYKIPVKVNPNN